MTHSKARCPWCGQWHNPQTFMAFLTQQSFVSSLREGDMEKLFSGAWAALMRVGIWVIDPSPCFKQKYLHMPDGCISGKCRTSWKFLKCSTDINSPKAHRNVPGKCSQTPLKACIGPSTLPSSAACSYPPPSQSTHASPPQGLDN